LRELLEETGVVAHLGELLAVYEIIEPQFHYVLIDYVATWLSGEPVAGDDADLAQFLPFEQAMALIKHADIKDVLLRARRAVL